MFIVGTGDVSSAEQTCPVHQSCTSSSWPRARATRAARSRAWGFISGIAGLVGDRRRGSCSTSSRGAAGCRRSDHRGRVHDVPAVAPGYAGVGLGGELLEPRAQSIEAKRLTGREGEKEAQLRGQVPPPLLISLFLCSRGWSRVAFPLAIARAYAFRDAPSASRPSSRGTVRQGGKEELRASVLKTYLLRVRTEKGDRAVRQLLAVAGIELGRGSTTRRGG